jgi:class 3 adenylate cyclase
MEPQIRFAVTDDGMELAYYTLGSGPDVVSIGLPGTHLLAEWDSAHETYETAAQLCRFTRFDPRGFGMSTRPVETISPETIASDIDAVVRRVGAEQINLIAISWAVPGAIAYAARHPRAAQRLVLVEGSARGIDFMPPALMALVELARTDWELASEAIAHFLAGWDDPDASRLLAAILRMAVGPSDLIRFTNQLSGWDVTTHLSELKMPVLLIPGKKYATADIQRTMATALSDARVVATSGSIADQQLARTAAITTFLLEGIQATPEAAAVRIVPTASGTAVILFTDIVSSTALTERMGDTGFRDASRALDASLRSAIREAGGAAIDGKLLGDGILATFPSAAQAIDGARHCLALSALSELRLHIGLHAGDVIREENNVYGGAVNIASRICGLSAPGEILVSDVVRGMARSSAGVEFEDRGEHEMKGVAEPVRVYEVRNFG